MIMIRLKKAEKCFCMMDMHIFLITKIAIPSVGNVIKGKHVESDQSSTTIQSVSPKVMPSDLFVLAYSLFNNFF
uniref:Uncharacterized protein n=1 Tax=Lepeophtheirus salmonis TaxID=72036 RepID=A0A0K2SX57_LEPSM